jgi:rubrerythrin
LGKKDKKRRRRRRKSQASQNSEITRSLETLDREASDVTEHPKLLYCHACANRWYREEGDILCPNCSSYFTEFVTS